MKFKVVSSDKFDYMLLSRLKMDCEYFINNPALKHLWAKDIDKQIDKMLEIYNRLDPKPEWLTEQNIYEYEKEMKEVFNNKNKITSSEQPTTPKPTTTLPDNMMYAWDPRANQWIIVMKDNPVVTPPTYNPNNLNNTTTTNYVSNIKSESKYNYTTIDIDGVGNIYKLWFDFNFYNVYLIRAKNEQEAIDKTLKYAYEHNSKKVVDKETAIRYSLKNDPHASESIDYYRDHPSPELHFQNTIEGSEVEYLLSNGWSSNSNFTLFVKFLDIEKIDENNFNKIYNNTTTQMYTPVKSSLINSLNQFLDGDKYSKEIKIEKGLISGGLIKLAGINPIRGPKYSITDKGLNLLKQAAQEEHDFEKDYIKARKSYLLDGISESEFQTGAPEEQGRMPKFSIFEKDGSELAQIEAKNSTDAKVKFFMENPEYEGSQSIEVKEIDSAYGQTTIQGLDFPNQSVSPSTDIKVDTKGWVNVQSAKLTPQLLSLGGILDPYIKNGSVGVSIEDENKGNISVRGDAKTINTIESKVRDLGIFCNNETLPADEGKGIYTLNIFLER